MSSSLPDFHFSPIPRQSQDFQRSLTAEQIALLIQHNFGSNLPVSHVQELSSGLFNNTYLIQIKDGDSLILRVAPDPAVEIFTHEENILRREPLLEPHLDVIDHLIPHIINVDFTQRLINRDYIFQQFLAGELWDEVQGQLSSEDSAALWKQLAHIARKIHSVQGSGFGFPYPQAGHARWSDALVDIASMMRENLVALNLDAGGTTPYIEMLDAGRYWLDQITIPRLLHGDLWPKNVLIDRRSTPPQIIGLLDAERGFWGDPLAEWIFYYLDIPTAFWDIFGHPARDPGTRFRYLAYRGLYAIQLLLEAKRFAWDPQPQQERLLESTDGMAAAWGRGRKEGRPKKL